MNLQLHCVIRKDLGFNVGLMSAQVAHLAMEQLRQMIRDEAFKNSKDYVVENVMKWLVKPYTIVHEVPCKEALEFYLAKSRSLNVKTYEWRDTVFVSLGSKKEALADVLVGFAFEVADADRIKSVIGDLPLLS